VADLIQADAVEGEVVRTRRVVTQRDQQGRARRAEYWIAVDDGTSRSVRAWRVAHPLYRRVNQTDIIRARVTRHYRHVSALQVVVHHPKIDLERLIPVLSGRLGVAREPDQAASGR